ncbi:hypothetical protein AABB24_003181 [Solanum stoloniferum]|uniref:non-specific serine/threonine protein kinase n=1 Tax=Solanum stoloniferum TaxID=62892 RepID=A0ABD2VA87_9SOLN
MGLLTPKTLTIFIILFSLLHLKLQAQKMEHYNLEYASFDQTFFDIFEVESPATISNFALQVTPDSASSDFNLNNNSGRILFKRPFKLWDGDVLDNKTRVASFNSSFLVNIYRPKNETAAEGLTFLISPDLEKPDNSQGQYLGLTNATTDGKSSNKVVAVELDTSKQSFDPDGNHIGIDVHSVRSVKVESLTPHGIELAPMGARFYNVWVQYDGIKKVLDVYIVEQAQKNGSTPPIPKTPILTYNLDLKEHVNQESYFGFSASTGTNYQLNCVLRWNLTVEYFPEKKNPWLKIVLGVGIPVVVLLILAAAYLGYCYHKKRIDRSQSNILGALKSLPGTPQEFQFKALKKATNNFDEKNKLGQGGYGVVYRGFLAGEENKDIAVKWFSRESIKGQDDFLAELTIINRLRHKHLVKLLGWCHKNGKLLLVYEYMPNGSLDMHLFAGPDKESLSWHVRYKIVQGVASALHYLHNEYDQRVVHRDLKASNIMLDSKFNARLGDFGLARALDNERTSYAEAEGVLGTMGYIAPECFHTGKATQQSDVYAFGAVLLEVVCGQRPGTKINGFQFFVDWVWYLHRDGRILEAVDPRLGGDYVADEAKKLLLLGLACAHPIATDRPKTQAIVQIISGSAPAPEVPPFKPAFVWPSMMPIDIDSSVMDTTSITTSQFNSGWSLDYQSRETPTYADHSLV